MAVSKIQKPALEYVQTNHIHATVASATKITELTIPSTGTYLICWGFAFNAAAWFNGVSDMANSDYHVGMANIFVRECQANEKIWLKNGAGSAVTFYGTFTAIRIA